MRCAKAWACGCHAGPQENQPGDDDDGHDDDDGQDDYCHADDGHDIDDDDG